MTAQSSIDLDWRPETYWPESPNRDQLLSRIQGEARRLIAEYTLDEVGIGGLDPELAAEELSEERREEWGAIHPQFMGGEFLPPLAKGEVEIARISLDSTTYDQISVRARKDGTRIRYSIANEYYDEEYLGLCDIAFEASDLPLTLRELTDLIDGSGHPDEPYGGGLMIGRWNCIFYEGQGTVDDAVAFTRISSAFYPDLAPYYAEVAEEWKRENDWDVEEEDDDEWYEKQRREREIEEQTLAPFREEIEKWIHLIFGPTPSGRLGTGWRARAWVVKTFIEKNLLSTGLFPTGTHDFGNSMQYAEPRVGKIDFDDIASKAKEE